MQMTKEKKRRRHHSRTLSRTQRPHQDLRTERIITDHVAHHTCCNIHERLTRHLELLSEDFRVPFALPKAPRQAQWRLLPPVDVQLVLSWHILNPTTGLHVTGQRLARESPTYPPGVTIVTIVVGVV